MTSGSKRVGWCIIGRRARHVFAVLVAGACVSCAEAPTEEPLEVAAVLSGDTTGFARAVAPRDFSFPEDHGPHPAYKTEWWYYTGNLFSDAGDRYGFQLTFFRSALAAGQDALTSPWRSGTAYMAHFAVSDLGARQFHAFERFSRSAVGLAGARAAPVMRVWLEDWYAEGRNDDAGMPVPVMRVSAEENGIGLELVLENEKPPVLQGDRGLSQKGQAPGNASYYYSLTRMRAQGTLQLGDKKEPVSGSAWMDREWSTSVLEANQVGWDWFALQLSDSTEIMLYQLRRRDGSPDPNSRAVLIDSRGYKRDVLPGDFRLTVLEWWTSPRGATYPSGWRLEIGDDELDVTVKPAMSDQELDVSFRYWEGAVDVTGTRSDRPISGVGYVELTGYTSSHLP